MKNIIKLFLALGIIWLTVGCSGGSIQKELDARTKMDKVEFKVNEGDLKSLTDVQLTYLELEEIMMMSQSKVIKQRSELMVHRLEYIAHKLDSLQKDSLSKHTIQLDTTPKSVIQEYLDNN